MPENETFAELMRKNARLAVTFTDKVIGAKFAMTIGTDDVYAESVLAFYEVYKYLESAMRAQRGKNLGRLMISGLPRTQAFVRDLNNYLGSNWVIPYHARESTVKYVEHMQSLYMNDPDLLIPYVYHLYMELLTGGQLIKTRKELDNVFDRHDGEKLGTAVVNFAPHDPIEMRKRLAREVNAIAATLDEEKKKRLIREGNVVYQYVTKILWTMDSIDQVLMERIILAGFCILGSIIVYNIIW